ncbi:hypothetical protein CLAFUW4_02028 [Fulvia fulva]|uniref:Uncharacterized protein n=1 Tax=Passalora fulva TaxID=5499 RepID=A0A9Q8L7U4_PASFU|nr:uncharacterized protein CLAFUR5_02022 [Fulvia fulva]KAK4635745.1 hypothetical protein CLAFUR4_02024 [Fulvia fulva]KAK4637830.1 hypothetical protein CLAFUR0_02027 [Fulvia fulva]UJO12500.1 hypothetical protein CLAFUR5_02022 [Fulvia fulva]WPV08260.1 hypothetical protein CLAFUW4_02028 [Fulvia fulva]WPV24502.1 hypothetical protein CLAFUW7_02028 [Fulvia fulva]
MSTAPAPAEKCPVNTEAARSNGICAELEEALGINELRCRQQACAKGDFISHVLGLRQLNDVDVDEEQVPRLLEMFSWTNTSRTVMAKLDDGATTR